MRKQVSTQRKADSLDFDALDMALSAAEAGIGIAISDVVLSDQAVREGRLSILAEQAVSTGVSYFLVRRAEIRKRRQVTVFESWLMHEIQEARNIVRKYSDRVALN